MTKYRLVYRFRYGTTFSKNEVHKRFLFFFWRCVYSSDDRVGALDYYETALKADQVESILIVGEK